MRRKPPPLSLGTISPTARGTNMLTRFFSLEVPSPPRTRDPGSARHSRRSGWASRPPARLTHTIAVGLVPTVCVFDYAESVRRGCPGEAGHDNCQDSKGAMLSRLSIRDIVLIDRLDIDFADGLAVLTGETGAGKSILLDAFALALGARGDQTLVRQGQVTAAFEVKRDHPARTLLKANDIAAEDELILRRVQFADGRTRAFVNDQPVGVQVLKTLGSALVEIHGQHDERALVDASTHRRLLDAFGG